MWQTIYIFFPGPGSNPHVTQPLNALWNSSSVFSVSYFWLKKKKTTSLLFVEWPWFDFCGVSSWLHYAFQECHKVHAYPSQRVRAPVTWCPVFAGETDWYLVKQCHHFLVISKYGGGDTLRSCKYPIPHHNFTYCISIQIIFAYHDYYYDLVKWRFSNFVTPSGLISWHSTMKISLLSNLIIYLSICNEW